MTRINLLYAEDLTDQHLMAEIKEINQLAGSFRRSLNSKNGIRLIKDFTLNKGHVLFFYDKGYYLKQRFEALKAEALRRNYNITAIFNNVWKGVPEYCGDWKPSERDYSIIIERINQKLDKKPDFYTYKKVKIDKNFRNRYKKYLRKEVL